MKSWIYLEHKMSIEWAEWLLVARLRPQSLISIPCWIVELNCTVLFSILLQNKSNPVSWGCAEKEIGIQYHRVAGTLRVEVECKWRVMATEILATIDPPCISEQQRKKFHNHSHLIKVTVLHLPTRAVKGNLVTNTFATEASVTKLCSRGLRCRQHE